MKQGCRIFKVLGGKHLSNLAFVLVVVLLAANLVQGYQTQLDLDKLKASTTDSGRDSVTQYTGNPFTTDVWPGQLQSENITGMHYYTWLNGALQNRTDLLANPTDTPNYIVEADGTYAWMTDCSTGQVDWNSTAQYAVIQAAVGNLTSDRTWYEQVYLKGNFTLDGALVPQIDVNVSYTHLTGSAYLKLADNQDTAHTRIIDVTADYVLIENLVLDGNADNNLGAVAGGQGQGIRIIACSHVLIRNVITRDNRVFGLCATSPTVWKEDIWYVNCKSFGDRWDGMDMYYKIRNSGMIGCHVEGKIGDIAFGMATEEGNIIADCTCRNIIGTQGSGGGDSNAGITVCGGGEGHKVTGCELLDVKAGITDDTTVNHSIFIGNTVRLQGAGGTDDARIGIGLFGHHDLAEGNYVFMDEDGNNQRGHWVYGDHARIINDYVRDTGTGTGRYGIFETGDSDGMIAYFNDLTDCPNPFKFYGTNGKVRWNKGYVTENEGLSELSNDDWFAHGCAGTPDYVQLIVEESDAPYSCQLKAKNSTHCQVYLYDIVAAGAEDVDKTIHWSVIYEP